MPRQLPAAAWHFAGRSEELERSPACSTRQRGRGTVLISAIGGMPGSARPRSRCTGRTRSPTGSRTGSCTRTCEASIRRARQPTRGDGDPQIPRCPSSRPGDPGGTRSAGGAYRSALAGRAGPHRARQRPRPRPAAPAAARQRRAAWCWRPADASSPAWSSPKVPTGSPWTCSPWLRPASCWPGCSAGPDRRRATGRRRADQVLRAAAPRPGDRRRPRGRAAALAAGRLAAELREDGPARRARRRRGAARHAGGVLLVGTRA